MTSTQITSATGTNLTTEAWDIINSYFAENPNWLARHQLDSYNDFVSHKMPLIFKNVNKTTAFMFDKLDGDNNISSRYISRRQRSQSFQDCTSDNI